MIKTATRIEKNVGTYCGDADLFYLEPPLDGLKYVLAIHEPAFGQLQKPVMKLVAARENGGAISMHMLDGSYSHAGVDDSPDDARRFAFAMLGGYEMREPEPEVEQSTDDVVEFEVSQRVYQAAFALGITSTSAVDILESIGFAGNSPDSMITAEAANALAQSLQKGTEDGGK